ncbi:MAG: hypothetical protein ACTSUK_11360 [Promethearchaeota archaeon]
MIEKFANHIVFCVDERIVHCNVEEGWDQDIFEGEQSEIVGINENRIVILDNKTNNLMIFDFENTLQYEKEFPWAKEFNLHKGFLVAEDVGVVETIRLEDFHEFTFDPGANLKGSHIIKLEKKGIVKITSYISVYPLTGGNPKRTIEIPNIFVDAFTTNSYVYAIRYDQKIGIRAIPLNVRQGYIDYSSDESIKKYDVTSENSLLLKFEEYDELVIFTKDDALTFRGTSIKGITVF